VFFFFLMFELIRGAKIHMLTINWEREDRMDE